ncbi:MAG: chorismate synthase [Planctomycetaceae bacterium]|jgi:chorismate synthase|nr:chorismate synthase [Planctomycetaceae bacterium]
MLRYFTAGESHGKGNLAFVDSFPAGLFINKSAIDKELRRRQSGYGRGGRQKIETDEVEILTGVWHDVTIGSPITLWVKNRDFKINSMPDLEAPRPGHGDLAGLMKYHAGIRPILERSSARATTATVAAGALAKLLLEEFDIHVAAYVVAIGGLTLEPLFPNTEKAGQKNRGAIGYSLAEIFEKRDQSELFSLRGDLEDEARRLIDHCAEIGTTLGGEIEIRADGVPFGLGTHSQWDLKLDGRLSQAIMAVQAIKGVEIGLGFDAAGKFGQEVHDPIEYNAEHIVGSEICVADSESVADSQSFGFSRPTNNAGGIEAGMTNSEPIVVRAAMKPIATLKNPLPSVNLRTLQPSQASYERSDVCAVPAASVVLEAVVALEIASALTEKFGGDSLEEMKERFKGQKGL